SNGDRMGSEFVVRLPRMVESHRGPLSDGQSLDETPCTASVARKLLLVDDNVDLVLTMAALLKKAGHEVETALDGPAALECLGHFLPDMIFVDIGLPGMDGYEVAKRLREQLGPDKVLIVAMTGYG